MLWLVLLTAWPVTIALGSVAALSASMMTRLRAPVASTALYRPCSPACQLAALLSCGSLNNSKATSGRFANSAAACDQNSIDDGLGAVQRPGVAQVLFEISCRSTIAT